MKVIVDKDICIGCGACQGICPDIFSIDDEGLAVAKEGLVPETLEEDAKDAVESCPVSAIAEETEDTVITEAA